MWTIGLSILSKFWPYILGAAILLSVVGYISYLRWDNESLSQRLHNAQVDIDTAVDANSANTKAIAEMEKEAMLDRAVTSSELDKSTKRAVSTEAAKKEMQNVPLADAPVDPFFDVLAERLRSLREAPGS